MQQWTYLGNEVLALLRHSNLMTLRIREVDGLRLYKLVHLLVVVVASVERREANNHFVGKNSDGPPVYWERVTFLGENFRSKVIRGTAE